MRVPIVDPLGPGRGRSRVREAEDNLIVLQAPTSSLTLLDTDPDSLDCDYPDAPNELNQSDTGGHSEWEQKSVKDSDHDFWKRLLSTDLHYDHDIPLDDSTFSQPADVYTADLVLEPDTSEPPRAPIQFSSKRKYENLFHWDFERYSFPSRQLDIAKAGHKPKKGAVKSLGKKEQTEEEKGEIERFKQEIRIALNQARPPPIPLPQSDEFVPYTKQARISRQPNKEANEDHPVDFGRQHIKILPVGDLLGEYKQEESISLLDMDNETPSKARGRGGYRWSGPMRDIETGRPVTPYKDDSAPRGRPFPPSGSKRGRGGGGMRGISPTPVGGIQPNIDQSTWVRVHTVIPPKASTRSLPSVPSAKNGAEGIKHHPSMPSGQSNPAVRPINNIESPYFRLISTPQARSRVPREELHSTNELQRSIMRSWSDTRADPATQKAIIDLLEWLSATINLALCPYRDQRRKKRRFEVDVFGSVAWGGETGSSGDLDLVVLVSGFHDQKEYS